jgi:hypothetical protein
VVVSVGLTLVALGGLAVALTRETRHHAVAAREGA